MNHRSFSEKNNFVEAQVMDPNLPRVVLLRILLLSSRSQYDRRKPH